MTLGPGRCEHLTGQLLALRGESAAPRAVLCDYRSRELRSVAIGDQALVEAASPVHHDGMLPDTGRYEERYRLTSRDGAALGAGVFALLAGILLPNAVPFIVFGGAVTLLYIVVLAGHRVAFRADNAGIMLGVNLTGLKLYRVNIPWADVEKIILYSLRQVYREDIQWEGKTSRDYIGIQRREDAPALVHGNQPAAWSPEPRIAAGATRPITTWQLDRDRLDATLAVVAPAIQVVDYGIIDVKHF